MLMRTIEWDNIHVSKIIFQLPPVYLCMPTVCACAVVLVGCRADADVTGDPRVFPVAGHRHSLCGTYIHVKKERKKERKKQRKKETERERERERETFFSSRLSRYTYTSAHILIVSHPISTLSHTLALYFYLYPHLHIFLFLSRVLSLSYTLSLSYSLFIYHTHIYIYTHICYLLLFY